MFNSEILFNLSNLYRRMVRLHRLFVMAAEVAVFLAAGILAFLLRFDFSIPPSHVKFLYWGLAIWIPVKLLTFCVAGMDRGWGRFVSIHDVAHIAAGNAAASAFGGVLIRFLAPNGFPRSIYLLDLLLCFLGTAGVRVVIRMVAEVTSQGPQSESAKSTLVYGAGAAGDMLLREIRADRQLPYRVLGFLDDSPSKKGYRIQGIPVLGAGGDLAALVRKHASDSRFHESPLPRRPILNRVR